MPKTETSKPGHISTADTLWQDLGFSREESAILELKHRLHSEIEKEVKRQKLTPKQLTRVLDVQQPKVSDLLRGKLSNISTDKLTRYLIRLGRQVEVKTKKAPKLQGPEVA